MTDLLPLLQEFYRDKLALLLQHQAGARRVAQYDVNNAYQYIVNRDETHLAWLQKAIAELGGTVVDDTAAPGDAAVGKGPSEGDTVRADVRAAEAFVAKWRPRIDAMSNIRHAKMLGVILGEALEQQRSFEQALAGRTDLLGRRGEQLEPAHGAVLPSRWIE